ncbi:hypothetical protein OE766_08760 [Pararhizobium sp. YC-54]|uniref:hypothetical protein n=1 Tax=Pararhizobium sp. YC-54 TaxID=2986920 RepID=UPI0021F71D81|nr:hypothetical protein [Pararhizobium sp. YC-54]MCV9998336.1 hypothetical protein [Pararhizobium sp. YC-54]
MKPIFKTIRLPRKVMFLITGVVVLFGASGAYAVYSGKETFLGMVGPEKPSLSGLACTTIETLKMRRNGQRWIRKYVSTDSAAGVDRVRTALRIAGLLAKEEKADLYQVVVLDAAGPSDRAARRGAAIGAEVLFAPDPAKLPGMSTPFVARYNDGKANTAGLFYGREVALSTDDVKTTLTAMDDKSDCFDPVAAAAAAEGGAVGSESGSHSETAAAAGHGEEAAAPEHGAGAPLEQSEAQPAEQGFFGSMLAMVLGSDSEKPSNEGHAAEPIAEHPVESLLEQPAGH